MGFLESASESSADSDRGTKVFYIDGSDEFIEGGHHFPTV